MSGEIIAIQQEQKVEIETLVSTQEMAARLADLKAKLGLVQKFFKEVMVEGQDYGVIPGTDKPSLLKAGAEKLCELYGFAPVVKNIEEEKDRETGFYRARVTVALIHRRTGTVVAEGVGEANTMEARYRYRWVPESKLPEGVDKSALYSEWRQDRKTKKYYKLYRLDNQDPWTLWNTVLKMAKKRALIDATLSATRSSGIFTQDAEDLEEWIQAAEDFNASEYVNGQTVEPEPPKVPKPVGGKMAMTQKINELRKKVVSLAEELRLDKEAMQALMKERYTKTSLRELSVEELEDLVAYLEASTKSWTPEVETSQEEASQDE